MPPGASTRQYFKKSHISSLHKTTKVLIREEPAPEGVNTDAWIENIRVTGEEQETDRPPEDERSRTRKVFARSTNPNDVKGEIEKGYTEK